MNIHLWKWYCDICFIKSVFNLFLQIILYIPVFRGLAPDFEVKFDCAVLVRRNAEERLRIW